MSNTSDEVSRADNRAKIIGSWTNKTIILSSLIIYIPKLKKQSRQSRNNFFSSCLIDVI